MSEVTAEAPEETKKTPAKKLVLTLIGVILAAGAGFFATYSSIAQNLLIGGDSHKEQKANHSEDVEFIAIEPITITYPGPPGHQFRLAAQLEVNRSDAEDVARLMPRVLDVLNGFLRAMDPVALSDRAAWYDLRLKMLYRIRMVVGEDRIRDVLITEFILH